MPKNGQFQRVFQNPEAYVQTVLPDRSLLKGQKLLENAKIEKLKCDIFRHFPSHFEFQFLNKKWTFGTVCKKAMQTIKHCFWGIDSAQCCINKTCSGAQCTKITQKCLISNFTPKIVKIDPCLLKGSISTTFGSKIEMRHFSAIFVHCVEKALMKGPL